ncbi:hypothetical protein AYK26_05885 [Euryarchaeota archaeon SM23-78]|nr:MAG: hypothetical protein AYK26_05885 [Euryarchaeota archaeon SM23-78]
MVNILYDGLLHFGAGVALSWADYATCRAINRKTDRVEQKKECLESIELLLDSNAAQAQPAEVVEIEGKPVGNEEKQEKKTLEENVSENTGRPSMNKDSMQYALNVEQVKDYFIREGFVKKDLPFFQKAKNFFRNLVYEERLNNLSTRAKLIFAAGTEFLYDSLIGIKYYTQIRQQSPLASIANNIYQIPAFFAGLVFGNWTKKGFDYFRSREEKKLDKTIKKLVTSTDIVDLVLTYQPPEEIKPALEKHGFKDYASKLTTSGKRLYEKMGKNVKELTYNITHIRERREQKEAERKKALQDRFDNITKDR